ncbi:MAG: ABC transporter permease [Mycobacteriales bacterium]|nr:ABC transporter permease [Frankia sp.]
MTAIGAVTHQIRYDLKVFVRNPASLFFTAALPVIFLVVFATIFGNEKAPGHDYRMATYYVPGIVGLSVVSATFVNLAISLTILRENGVLKRVRGTPLRPSVFIAGRIATALVIAAVLVVVVGGIGALLYDVRLPSHTLPGLAVTLVVAATSFCALGIAATSFIPSENASSPITNAIVLPLYFISGTFFSVDEAPSWLRQVASYFPIRHFNEAMFAVFDPRTRGAGVFGGHLLVIALWGLVGLVVARRFRWSPRATRD